jgi:phosphohistidine phosphatase
MKTLLIMRHAKSSWKDAGLDDHDRTLNRRGKEAAPRMGCFLQDQGVHPGVIFCSSAKRASATAKLVVEAAGWDVEIHEHADLYLAAPSQYLSIVQERADPADVAMVVGHNPGLEQLIYLTTSQAEAMPTAAVARVEFNVDQWHELDDSTAGQLRDLWRPRELE